MGIRIIVDYLRYPLNYISKSNIKRMEIEDLSNDEILTMYGKIDDYIEHEGKERRAFGSYDEMYVLELLNVKDRLKKEIDKRHENEGVQY